VWFGDHRRHCGIDVTCLEFVSAMRFPQGNKVEIGHHTSLRRTRSCPIIRLLRSVSVANDKTPSPKPPGDDDDLIRPRHRPAVSHGWASVPAIRSLSFVRRWPVLTPGHHGRTD